MIRTTILLALFVLIPLVACNSQDKKSESSKVTKDTKTNLETNKEVKSEPKKETSKNSVEVQASVKKDCRKESGLDIDLALILCDGAVSLKPVVCFNAITISSNEAAAILCSGTNSAAPVACFQETIGRSVSGSDLQGAILCSGVTLDTWIDRVECYNDARGTYYKRVVACAEKGKQWTSYLRNHLKL